MRTQGRLTEWNDERGFGFITPLDGGARVFVHVSEFPAADRRPIVNDLVTFEVSHDERGRARAVRVNHLTPVRQIEPPQSAGPMQFSGRSRSRRLASPALVPILAVALVLTVGLMGAASMLESRTDASSPEPVGALGSLAAEPGLSTGDSAIQAAFADRQSGIQVQGQGRVSRVLADDTNGDRHQRFILALDSGQTLLVAHNIDIAPRVGALAAGTLVSFSGEYEWNSQGGVIHWTHHDPSGRHVAGWLDVGGSRYQ